MPGVEAFTGTTMSRQRWRAHRSPPRSVIAVFDALLPEWRKCRDARCAGDGMISTEWRVRNNSAQTTKLTQTKMRTQNDDHPPPRKRTSPKMST